MKLVFEYYYTDGCTFECTSTIPLEYSSKDDFILMVLDKIDSYRNECIEQYGKKDGKEWYRNGSISILRQEYNVGNLEDCIEHRVYELEEWFETKKNKI
jgi:hypothetical protein